MKTSIFILVVGSLLAISASADQAPLKYHFHVKHLNADGTSSPFVDKEVSVEAIYQSSSNSRALRTFYENTDQNGDATLEVSMDPPWWLFGGKFQYTERACAKLDGPHYCNGAFPVENNKLYADEENPRYSCLYSGIKESDGSRTMNIVCQDR